VRSIIVDAGPLVALFLAGDRYHRQAKAVIEASRAVMLTTWPVVTEACHFLGQAHKRALLTLIRRGGLRLAELAAEDLVRLDELIARHGKMDFADATLVVLAERTGVMDIFTIDRRDFEAYRVRDGRRFRLITV
jgi:predicted nucleic acid-binding protein